MSFPSSARLTGWCAVFLAVLIVPCAASADAIDTPQKVWADYDPRTEPLDIEVLKKWSEDNADYTEMYFTGMTEQGEKVRVYALFSAPTGGKHLPGVMHIHGGGQTASLRWLRFWNERGYAALTFDFCGKWNDRPKHTLWGKLVQGNMGSGHKKATATEPSVRVSSWYLWARIARRALTCLERQPQVDPDRLGIFGVSVGGSLVWPVAGTDRRVKAACAIYGVGWNTYPAEVDTPDPKADDPQVKLWRSAMEPESYAPLVKCPILFLDGTNDHHGKMDWAYRTLDSVTAEHRQAFSPHWRHHIALKEGRDLPLWMETWLKGGPAWPKTPNAEVTLDSEGVPRLKLTPDASQKVTRVDCFYAVENRNPINRFWRSVDSKQEKSEWLASLPILDATKPLFVFANVSYESGVTLSSNLVSSIPAKLGPAKATDTRALLIEDLKRGAVDWYTRSPGTDPNQTEEEPPVKVQAGPDGIRGLAVKKFAALHTHKVGDPKWRGPEGASLQFQVFAPVARTLNVRMIEREFAKGSNTFTASIKLKPAENWQTITLTTKEFHGDKKAALRNWQYVQMLELEPGHDPGPGLVYTNFRWVK